MPTYQYLCTECGDQVEAVQKFTDDPLTVHDECGGRLRKVFSPLSTVESMELLVEKLDKTRTNAEFLNSMSQM